jgi:acetylglutamate kinase
MTMKSS